MAIARKHLVEEGKAGVYHCVSRCVRRAFLCGYDQYSGKDYSHRKAWIQNRLKDLAAAFGVEVYAYAVMSNHLHVVAHIRPDLVAQWSAREVVERWLKLFPEMRDKNGHALMPDDETFENYITNPNWVALRRERLGSLSWFMRCLNEPIARRANKEDDCKGRFWEGRFSCQRLGDEGAILACMAYVDLNPVRAKVANTLEDSEFTSVYDRIVSEQAKKNLEATEPLSKPTKAQSALLEETQSKSHQADWLKPIGEASRGYTVTHGLDLDKYLELLDWTGRQIRSDKRGSLPSNLAPILKRLDLDHDAWVENVERLGSLFYNVIGKAEHLLESAKSKGMQWLKGKQGSHLLYQIPDS